MPKHIPKEIKEALVKEYKGHPITIEQVATKYGISSPSVVKILTQYGVKVWSKEKLFSPNLDENYFEKIDSHKKAYFLGLITTDGCVFWKNCRCAFLSITLKKPDQYVLEDFMRDICCNRKLVYSSRDDAFTATVTSSKIVSDLEKYNIKPRSSLKQEFYSDLTKEYFADYLRGLIDGDGSFAFYVRPGRNVHKKYVCMCSGSLIFIEEFVNIMCEVLGVKRPRIRSVVQHNLYDVRWYRKDDVETIITFLYSTNGPCLLRKKEIADRILAEIRQYRDNSYRAVS